MIREGWTPQPGQRATRAARVHAGQREQALCDITRALASDLDEQRVLELAIHHAQQLFGAPCARVWLLDEQRSRLQCVASTEYLRPKLLSDGLPLDSLTGEVAVRGVRTLKASRTRRHSHDLPRLDVMRSRVFLFARPMPECELVARLLADRRSASLVNTRAA